MRYFDTVRGKYPQNTTSESAEVLIGSSFGTETHQGSVNFHLASYIQKNAGNRPVVADTMLAQLIELGDGENVHEVNGDPSSAAGGDLDSWIIQVAARKFMDENGLGVAEQVAHRHHIRRVGYQAIKAGILYNVFPPRDSMPYWFDRNSKQVWTRRRGLWIAREAVGIPVLKAQGKL